MNRASPFFCAKDVCDALGYKKTSNAIALHVDGKGALKQGTLTNRGIQQMLYVDESGLNALIMGSTHKAVNKHVDGDDSLKRGGGAGA